MRRSVVLITVISAMLLAGCNSSVDSAMEKEADEKKELYDRLTDSGKLDENGVYVDAAEVLLETPAPTPTPVAEPVEKTDGKVHVTFARNQSLSIHYFLDEARTKEVVNGCYLDPGECIYATEPKNTGGNDNYCFDQYKVYEYVDGKRLPANDWETGKKDMIFSIPEDYIGTEISIVPLGHYEEREIELDAYYMNAGNQKRDAGGEWLVNGEKSFGGKVRTSPVASCAVSYSFDPTQYFYVKSNPGELYLDETEGEVIFRSVSKDGQTKQYSVEVHPCISTTLETVDKSKFGYTISDGRTSEGAANHYDVSGLKFGDRITVLTKNDTSVISANKDYFSVEEREVADGFEHVFSVINPYETFQFDPAEYTDEHGRIIFRYNGREITEPMELRRGMEISYADEDLNDNYAISGKDKGYKIIVSDEKTTKQELAQIHYFKIVPVEVYLAQPEFGGRVVYTCNGKELIGNTEKVNTGDTVQLEFKPWPGWTCNLTTESVEITDSTKEITEIQGRSIATDLFKEQDSHKPMLTVILDGSLGKKLEVTVNAEGISEEMCYSNLLTIFEDKYELNPIGTNKEIQVSFAKDTIDSGKLVKVEFILDDTTMDTGYISDVSQTLNFSVYANGKPTSSSDTYSSIKLKVSKVDMQIYKAQSVTHGQVKVICSDSKYELKNGDYVDNDRMVKVRIVPDSGYCFKDGGAYYEEEMDYGKYCSKIDSILKKHPIQPKN